MQLRAELCPPAVPPRRRAELSAAIVHIADLLERGQPADDAIAAFNASTGHQYLADDFASCGATRPVEALAVEAARPAWPRVAGITHEELTEIVRRILAGDDDTDFYLLLLQVNLSHPRISDLLFWPPPALVDAPPEAIVDEALRYRPVGL